MCCVCGNVLLHISDVCMYNAMYDFSKLRISLGLKPLKVESSKKEETEELTIEGVSLNGIFSPSVKPITLSAYILFCM